MKIAITSDLHHAPGYTDKPFIQSMMMRVLSHDPDLIVVAGDIGEILDSCKRNKLNGASREGWVWSSEFNCWLKTNVDHFRNALHTIAELLPEDVDLAAVLGNHDLYTHGAPTSLELWETILPNVMDEEGVQNLEKSNWVKDGVAVVGGYLHYDYSSKDHKGVAANFIRNAFPDWTPDEYYERMKSHSIKDGNFLIGLPPDKEFAAQIGEGFRLRLQQAEDDPSIHSIVIVTHVPCMPCQITRHPFNDGWSMGTPYFGNLSHSDFILELTKVKHVVSGHSHNREHSEVTFNDGHEVSVQVLEAAFGNPTAVIVEV